MIKRFSICMLITSLLTCTLWYVKSFKPITSKETIHNKRIVYTRTYTKTKIPLIFEIKKDSINY